VTIAVIPSALLAIRSDLLVAAATLGVAGLFQPLRRRVQTAVDRRFDRTRHDAAHTVDRFVARAAGRRGADDGRQRHGARGSRHHASDDGVRVGGSSRHGPATGRRSVRSLIDRAAARVAAALWLVTLVVVAWGLVLPVAADLPRGTEELGNAPSVVLIAVINAALGVRLHRSDGVERQQVKLLFYAAAVGVCALVGANLVFPEAMEHAVVGNLVWGAAAAGLSLAITIALLRHRLFEIDRLISRTATYGTVTAVLALCYVTVAMLPAALYGLESDLLVAAATLVSAAVFVPVRRRVRAQMDRRFDRERYDAARVAATFGTSLRDAVDPDRVVDELVRVVEAALRPDGTQVWLRAASPRRPG
jgi:hypothetical protein